MGSSPEAIPDLMTIDHFRRIALSMSGTEELSGLGYPNFCVGRKSFATIEDSTAVLRLTRDQQATFVATAPEMFATSSGWGRLGRTAVRLEAVDEAMLRDALATAWGNVTQAAAGAVKMANAFKVSRPAVVVNGAAAGVEKLASDDGPADVTNVTDAAKAEPRDDLRDVIQRLQVYWGSGPA
jgi:hypothetical protein